MGVGKEDGKDVVEKMEGATGPIYVLETGGYPNVPEIISESLCERLYCEHKGMESSVWSGNRSNALLNWREGSLPAYRMDTSI